MLRDQEKSTSFRHVFPAGSQSSAGSGKKKNLGNDATNKAPGKTIFKEKGQGPKKGKDQGPKKGKDQGLKKGKDRGTKKGEDKGSKKGKATHRKKHKSMKKLSGPSPPKKRKSMKKISGPSPAKNRKSMKKISGPSSSTKSSEGSSLTAQGLVTEWALTASAPCSSGPRHICFVWPSNMGRTEYAPACEMGGGRSPRPFPASVLLSPQLD